LNSPLRVFAERLRGVEPDDRFDPALLVVLYASAAADDHRDQLDLGGRHQRSSLSLVVACAAASGRLRETVLWSACVAHASRPTVQFGNVATIALPDGREVALQADDTRARPDWIPAMASSASFQVAYAASRCSATSA
jgi:hypothetical protein